MFPNEIRVVNSIAFGSVECVSAFGLKMAPVVSNAHLIFDILRYYNFKSGR